MDALPYLVSAVPPAWVLALVLAALNVFVFHTACAHEGRSPLHLAPFGLLGFSAGNLVAAFLHTGLPSLGDVHVVEASLGAWLLLSVFNTRRPAG